MSLSVPYEGMLISLLAAKAATSVMFLLGNREWDPRRYNFEAESNFALLIGPQLELQEVSHVIQLLKTRFQPDFYLLLEGSLPQPVSLSQSGLLA